MLPDEFLGNFPAKNLFTLMDVDRYQHIFFICGLIEVYTDVTFIWVLQ